MLTYYVDGASNTVISEMKKFTLLLICFFIAIDAPKIHAQSPSEWVELGRRIHGGFGSYIAVGIRIGLDAMERLKANPRELEVTYQDGPSSPCPCVADGIMIATVATPGNNTLRVLLTPAINPNTFGIAIVKNQKTGETLRYTLPRSARSILDDWNKDLQERDRYDAVMNAPAESLFEVESYNRDRK
jgi:formylmethanofuran dehydrogenase subunit E